MSNNSYTFNKRYLVISIIIFIISVYISLDFDSKDISPVTFYTYTICFTSILSVCVLTLFFIFRKDYEIAHGIITSFLIVLVFISGITRTFYVNNELNSNSQTILSSTTLRGVITSHPELSTSGKSYAANANIYQVCHNDSFEDIKKPIKILLYTPADSASAPNPGDSFECDIAYEISPQPAYKGAFNYSRYLRQKKISSAIYSSDYTKTDYVYKVSLTDRLNSFGLKLRTIISASCESTIYSPDEKALLKGILLGDRTGFSDTLYESYTDSGLVHIISVSGMHTSYLFLVLAFVLSLLKIPRRFYAFIAIPVLIIFGATALFTPSVSRSVIMLSILLLAPLFLRSNDSITALFISAAIIIYLNPYNLESYSMLLSYSATLGILVYSNLMIKLLRPYTTIQSQNIHLRSLNYPIRYTVDSVCLTAGGTLSTSYFAARFFGRIPLAGFLANIPIFPLVAIAFIGGYINCILFYLLPHFSSYITAFVLKPVLYLINHISALFAQDFFSIRTPYPDKAFFIVFVVICYTIYLLLSSAVSRREK